MSISFQLLLIFFVISVLYSSVGFGGGSSYIAILYLFGYQFEIVRSTALLCNIVVVSGNLLVYHNYRLLSLRKIAPLVILSVPLAWLGGFMIFASGTAYITLACALLLSGVLVFLKIQNSNGGLGWNNIKSTGVGGAIGYLSGMVGIGGGIFLSPVLHLTSWDAPKRIAAAASLFILVNSIAGLFGQVSQNQLNIDFEFALPLMVTVLVGGQIGSRVSSGKFDSTLVRRLTAILIIAVSLKIFYDHIVI